jgi:carboxypeptidase Taq
MTAAADLTAYLRRVSALERVSNLLGWDMETQMPRRGAAQRAEEAAVVAEMRHALLSDPRLAELCDAAEAAGPDARGSVDIAEARRMRAQAVRVPARLAAELAAVTAEAQTVWEGARAAARFADFAPMLDRVVALKREEGACLAADGADPYDALLDRYEPGMTGARAAELFAALRPGLVALAARVADAPAVPTLAGDFPAEGQMAFAHRLGEIFGYDREAGRVDLAVHPSCTGRLADVRITTRIDPSDPLGNVYSVIHELGHALYEQGLDPEAALTPAGAAASMGVHESQSRLLENQIGRSRAFAEWLFGELRSRFGDIGVDDPEVLHRAVNAVRPGFIRTEADEVHYNLHVLMRFDLERALIGGDLDVGDLEDAWNARFKADFGATPPDAARGVLQDVHWSAGAFGYFPTYTIGNVYAAELDAALRADLPDLDDRLAAGDPSSALDWLRARIHRRGSLLPQPQTLVVALERKYGALYALG